MKFKRNKIDKLKVLDYKIKKLQSPIPTRIIILI